MLGVQSFGPVLPRGPIPALETAAPPRLLAERDAWVVLSSVPGLGPVTFSKLLSVFGTAGAALAAASAVDGPAVFVDRMGVLTTADGRRATATPAELARRIAAHRNAGEAIVERARAFGIEVVTLDDADYPARLRRIEFPPPLLFVQGDRSALDRAHAVAVVGTRCPTDRGRRLAGWIASAIARTGAVVVSGLAVGVDGAAHAAAVVEDGPTVGVLGGGHARLFPKAHRRLADAICAKGGAVVSELPPDTPPTRGTFPRRNRVISGLSDAVVVVEAGERSGALITAAWALEQGRECYLVPGPIDAPQSRGCNAFLRAFGGQARVVSGVAELVDDLAIVGGEAAGGASDGATRAAGASRRQSPSPTAVLAALSAPEAAVARAVAAGAGTADQLVARTDLPPATVLSVLTLLELHGLVASAYGRYAATGPLAGWEPQVPTP